MYVFRTRFVKETADAILEEFDDICESLDIIYCLVFGTCLGFYRDKGYVAGEHDLDVMPMCSDDKFLALIKALQGRGYVWRLGIAGFRWYAHAFKNDILLDIWREADDHGGRIDPGRVQLFCQSFDTVDYNGRTYNIPSPVEGYLQLIYGNHWTTPKRWGEPGAWERAPQELKGTRRIIVGGGPAQEGWATTNINVLNLLKPKEWLRYFNPGTLTAIFSEHVWEHLTEPEGVTAAKTCYRFLSPGGYVRVAVPDGFHPHPDYINWVRPGGVGAGSQDHKVLYTHKTLSAIFECVGFTVRLLEYYDKDGEFHFEPWDSSEGHVRRSKRFDRGERNGIEMGFTSLILDARKVT